MSRVEDSDTFVIERARAARRRVRVLQLPRWAKALAVGLTIGVVGTLVASIDAGRQIEQAPGLDWLYGLRGTREPPAEVVIVSMDTISLERLGLPQKMRKWPRSLHAELVRKLDEQEALAIAFDVNFDEPRAPDSDADFAAALEQSSRVVLFEYLKRTPLPGTGGRGDGPNVLVEQRALPIEILAQAAAGSAPFPLPKARAVNAAWLFKDSAGDVPTLPLAMLGVYAREHLSELPRLFRAAGADTQAWLEGRQPAVAETMWPSVLRELQAERPDLARRILDAIAADPMLDVDGRARLSAVFKASTGASSRYLDFYGPPRTITTVPYHRAVSSAADGGGAPPADRFRNGAVFIGFSEDSQPQEKDDFYTVYSSADGRSISGVEIAATMFANLLEGRHLRRLAGQWQFALLMLWALLIAISLFYVPAALVLPAGIGLGLGYTGVVVHAFSSDSLWLPFAVPLLVQLPGALALIFTWRYSESSKQRERLRLAFSEYLSPEVAERLARSTGPLEGQGEVVYAVCLSTDARNYSQLAGRLPADQLRALMNRYFTELSAPVARHGGHVSNLVADSMLAIWTAPEEQRELRERACIAAVEMQSAMSKFELREDEGQLGTRIGLHCGYIALGDVSAIGHREYRPVGEMVNTATRLEGLAKHLGTSLLVSRKTAHGVDGMAVRDLGDFCVVGRSSPIGVCELLGPAESIGAQRADLRQQFRVALDEFRAGRFAAALEKFEALADSAQDGPSRYYASLSAHYLGEPPGEGWNGIVRMEEK
ncbi:MAG: CHASE2 domain-containing protein [Gammaproteobacteria bacterium]